jgi:hypothetical protein
VETDDENKPILPIKGLSFERGIEERILQICGQGIWLPVWPDIRVVRYEDPSGDESDRCVIVMRILQSESTPHCVGGRRDVYVRPGNLSQPYERADIDEIQELFLRRSPAVERRNRFVGRFRERWTFYRRDYAKRFFLAGKQGFNQELEHWIDQNPLLELVCVPTFPLRPLAASLDDLKRVLEQNPPVRASKTSIDNLLVGDQRLAQESLIVYAARPRFQVVDISQYGLAGICEGSTEETASAEAAQHDSSSISHPASITFQSLRSTVLGFLLSAPKLYGSLYFGASVDFSVRIVNAQRKTLHEPIWGDISKICPDSEIVWKEETTPQEIEDSAPELYSRILQFVFASFGVSTNTEKEREDASAVKALVAKIAG